MGFFYEETIVSSNYFGVFLIFIVPKIRFPPTLKH